MLAQISSLFVTLCLQELCHLLIIFANSLDLDQAPQYVGPDLNPNPFGICIVFLKEYLSQCQNSSNLERSKRKNTN